MTRTAAALDRVVALIVGVVLVVVGVGALIWHAGLFTGLPQSITVPGLVDAMDTWWWRWAIAGVGLLCVGLALRWLVAHRPMGKAAPIRLHEAGDVGTITIDPAAVTTAAADTLRRHPAVRTAKGTGHHRPRHPHHRISRHRSPSRRTRRGDHRDHRRLRAHRPRRRSCATERARHPAYQRWP